ncbi:MAG: energy transducer TonB [Archangium sp.]|nr:energy transducer TonB [Archangium sp.]
MLRLVALVFSISVHIVAVVVLSSWPTSKPARPAPVEVELTFKEARRAPPPPAPAPVASTPPRRAKGSGGGGAKSPAPAHAAPLPIVPSPSTGGDFAALPPSGGGEDAGIGDDGEDEVTQTQTPPPPLKRTEAQLVSLPRIAYPERARLDEIEGVVVLWVTLGADGRVVRVEVRSSPDASLSDAARSALLRAEFRPATIGDQNVGTQFEYRYRFELQ